jgi:rubrerythrin
MSETRTGDKLANLLKKANEVEMAFENMANWEAYVSVKGEEFRQILFRLISDSQRHKNILNSLISKIKMSNSHDLIPLTPRVFDFKNRHELEIMEEIGRYEKLAFDLYTNIMEALKNSETKLLLCDENDVDLLTSSLQTLILEEKSHIDLVSKYSGRFQRLR